MQQFLRAHGLRGLRGISSAPRRPDVTACMHWATIQKMKPMIIELNALPSPCESSESAPCEQQRHRRHLLCTLQKTVESYLYQLDRQLLQIDRAASADNRRAYDHDSIPRMPGTGIRPAPSSSVCSTDQQKGTD